MSHIKGASTVISKHHINIYSTFNSLGVCSFKYKRAAEALRCTASVMDVPGAYTDIHVSEVLST